MLARATGSTSSLIRNHRLAVAPAPPAVGAAPPRPQAAAAKGGGTGLRHLRPAAGPHVIPGPALALVVTEGLHVAAVKTTPDGYSRRRHYRSRSRSSGHQSRRRNRRIASRSSRRDSRSPRTQRSRPRSPSPGRSVHLSLEDKRKLLEAAQANAMRTLGRNNLELPESVKPILSAPESVKPILSAMPPSKWELPETRVRHDLDKAPSQSEAEADEAPCPKMSPKSKMIAFSMNNSVAKPTVAVSGAKVTARADSYESRKPYGHWVPVKSV
ncbi:arginine/serine-rich protein 1 isoform X2 [Takifugu rubripes]|uniref:arginine/serine-rich protein 1 isoform X2 n=1 Tax=Takifugu rubripes TaxID=31033 RepID=UPI0005D2246A|nr:arginine/serine-rich protein 1 isoform X2 [Takifugu rubripes]|eukprot:XP_011613965.1 PREDICTED: arginine/serine-rich protein 1 isoform X2 [Takifugu rubripes]